MSFSEEDKKTLTDYIQKRLDEGNYGPNDIGIATLEINRAAYRDKMPGGLAEFTPFFTKLWMKKFDM